MLHLLCIHSLDVFLYLSQYPKMDFGHIHKEITKQESIELFDYIKRETQLYESLFL
jgi:hypothetical protein